MSSPAPYPGEPTVERYVDGDDHFVILDLSGLAFPLDGIVPTLLRTINDEGAWTCARGLGIGHHETTELVHLRSMPAIADVLRIPLTPDQAATLRDLLDDARLEPPKCARPGCQAYATAGEWCGPDQEGL